VKRTKRQKQFSLILLVTLVFSACSSTEIQSSTDSIIVEPRADKLQAFISVHMEVYPKNEIPAQWELVKDLVELSDEYGIALTLGFTATWGEIILDNEENLALIREWEASGHEISAHHHGWTHAVWDGYSSSHTRAPGYIGDIDDMMEILNQFTASGQIMSASGSDAETDWYEGITVKSYGIQGDYEKNLLSTPKEVTYNGQEVLEVMKAGYLTSKESVDVSFEDIEEAIGIAEEGEILGIALSDTNFATDGVMEGLEELFQLLNENDVETHTLYEVVN
jgi:hypothetical protein